MTNKSVYFAVQNDDLAEIPAVSAAVVHEANGNVPEARDLTWTDTFYDDSGADGGVIAVFDVDYEKLKRSIGCRKYLIFALIIVNGFVFLGPSMLEDSDPDFFSLYIWAFLVVIIFAPAMYAIDRQIKGVHGIHVAVTNEGIRKDLHKFPFGSMFRTTTIVSTVDQTVHDSRKPL
jgi:hypothetical protein